MNFLRRTLGKARNLTLNRHESSDKNEYNNKTVDPNCDSESSQEENIRDPFNGYMLKMINFVRELAIFCFIFMAYAAITNDPPKVSKAPAAYPFFPKDSPVKDFYRGQIVAAIEHARTTDLSFIMFYAPWDAESQAAIPEFEAAANFLKENIVFAAVNCWQPGSECRNQYSKVYRWPILIAYPTFGSGIQYNGPISAPYMISFLQKLMRPIKRTGDEILDFNEAFVVAEINTLPKSLEYSVYYLTAMKYLETDPLARIAFYVKPVKYSQNKLSLYLWNQVRVLEIEPGNWRVDTILTWLLKTIETPSSKVMPSGSKSLLLSHHLQPGPSLVLFTPINPLQNSNDYYLMLQEISQEYKNCEDWGLNFDMQNKRLANLQEHQLLERICQPKQKVPKAKRFPPTTTNLAFLNNTANLKPFPHKKIEFDCNTLGLDTKIINVCHNIKMGECIDVFPQLPRVYEGDNPASGKSRETVNYLDQSYFYKKSMLDTDSDPKSLQNLRKIHQRDKCKTFLAALKIQPPIFEAKRDFNQEKIEVSRLSCTNHSLEMVALDSLIYHGFAERLGIDLLKKQDKSAVVIINEKMEVHYIMEDPITGQNIRKFIRNFTNDTLSRSVSSSINVDSENTPGYTIKNNRDFNVPIMYVEELDSQSFLKIVLEKNKAVVVMYYSKQCSYCNGISYRLLLLARKLAFVENLEFYRIDGDINILPWMYTMQQFPTILFFPADQKEETRVFPSELPITVPNLLGFILTNVDPPMRLHAMYSICLQNQLDKDKNACLSTVRSETMSLIEQTLKNWRKSNNRHRQLLLYNLRQLRHLQFLFNHSPEQYQLIASYFKKLKNVKLSEDYSPILTKNLKDEL